MLMKVTMFSSLGSASSCATKLPARFATLLRSLSLSGSCCRQHRGKTCWQNKLLDSEHVGNFLLGCECAHTQEDMRCDFA